MIKDTVPGVIGNCTAGAAFGVAWLTDNAMPALHVLSVIFGIVASVATAMYYLLEWRARREQRLKEQPRRRVQRKKAR